MQETEIGVVFVLRAFVIRRTEYIEREKRAAFHFRRRAFFRHFPVVRKFDVVLLILFGIFIVFFVSIHISGKRLVHKHLEKFLCIGGFRSTHQTVQSLRDLVDVILIDAGCGEHLFDAADPRLKGTLNTKPLVNAFVVFKPGSKDERDILLTYRTKTHLF